jgi:transcriptional regulator with XRE-family HTH domain
MSILTPQQYQMAIAGLGLSVREVAEMAKVAPGTLTRLARGERLHDRTLLAVREALEAAGVEFLAENGGGAGVRLKKPSDR